MTMIARLAEKLHQKSVQHIFLSDNSRIKANWGKGFKAPTISELYMAMHRAMGWTDCKPSMVIQIYSLKNQLAGI